MSGADLALAAMLLTTPPGVPEPAPHPDSFPAVRDAIRELGVGWEVLDARETGQFFIRPEDYSDDLDLLRRRYQELRDAPRVSDCYRFPDRGEANERCHFNRAFRKYLSRRREFEIDRSTVLSDTIAETDSLYQVWDDVRDARCDSYYCTVRRRALARLRATIGDDAFRLGRLPAEVPVWRFVEMK